MPKAGQGHGAQTSATPTGHWDEIGSERVGSPFPSPCEMGFVPETQEVVAGKSLSSDLPGKPMDRGHKMLR